jgi:chlorite dismutase
MEPLHPSVGWGVLHLFYVIDRERVAAEPGSGKRVADAVASLEADDHQALVFAVLGHKADLGVMALGPDLARLQAFQQELSDAPLALVDSYLSLTELSEYTSTEDDERARLLSDEGLTGEALEAQLQVWRDRMEHYQEQRIHPRLPQKRTICFYPMSKRREPGANWYGLEFEERKRLMAGHARVGRTYAGRVLQLITGSTGLDDWEWGVTLLADDPVALKDIVSEMRFDRVSADYAEFGPFVTGLLGEPADVLGGVGLG